MRVTIEETLKKTGILVIDGSMSTALEQLGCNLKDSLWTAKALAESPELVKKVHLDYLKAGADCGITCSYQTTIPGLVAKGYTAQQAEELIVSSVTLFKQAREEWWEAEGKNQGRAYPSCLAGIGPYGAYLADGSEYRGNYGVDDSVLYKFHKRRMELLWNAGADILLLETQPSLHEALIEAEIAESLGADYWISFSCKNDTQIHEGNLIRDCATQLGSSKYPHLKMIGINCTAPQYVENLIKELKQTATVPIAVYPNSGEEYDPVTKTWHGNKEGILYGEYAYRWMKAGANAVGGCCRTVASHVEEVVQARNRMINI